MTLPEETPLPRVVIVGFDISFRELLKFTMRLALAAVPALILCYAAVMLLVALGSVAANFLSHR